MSGRFRPGLVATQSDRLGSPVRPPAGAPARGSGVADSSLVRPTPRPSFSSALARTVRPVGGIRPTPLPRAAVSIAAVHRRDGGGPSLCTGRPTSTPPRTLLDRKRGNHLCQLRQLRQLRVFGHVPSRAALCAKPTSTPRPNSSEGRRPPETEGVPKPVVTPSQAGPECHDQDGKE